MRLHALIHAFASTGTSAAPRDALPALEDLGTLLDSDLRTRVAPAGELCMSDIERAMLVPLLSRLRNRLQLLAHGAPSTQWIAVLHAADEDVARAERALVRH